MPRLLQSVIRVYDDAGNVIDTDEQAGQFALLRLMAPLMAIGRLVIASVCACIITAAGIHAVAKVTFALLMTVLYVGTAFMELESAIRGGSRFAASPG
jgi:hypothetical protein